MRTIGADGDAIQAFQGVRDIKGLIEAAAVTRIETAHLNPTNSQRTVPAHAHGKVLVGREIMRPEDNAVIPAHIDDGEGWNTDTLC